MHELLGLLGQAFDHVLVDVAQVAHRNAGQEVEIAPAVHVPKPAPFSLGNANGEPVIGICQKLFSLVDPFLLHC